MTVGGYTCSSLLPPAMSTAHGGVSPICIVLNQPHMSLTGKSSCATPTRQHADSHSTISKANMWMCAGEFQRFVGVSLKLPFAASQPVSTARHTSRGSPPSSGPPNSTSLPSSVPSRLSARSHPATNAIARASLQRRPPSISSRYFAMWREKACSRGSEPSSAADRGVGRREEDGRTRGGRRSRRHGWSHGERRLGMCLWRIGSTLAALCVPVRTAPERPCRRLSVSVPCLAGLRGRHAEPVSAPGKPCAQGQARKSRRPQHGPAPGQVSSSTRQRPWTPTGLRRC